MKRSSIEGLKLRRVWVRNDISFNRNVGGGTERTEDLGTLREELRELTKEIEEAEHQMNIGAQTASLKKWSKDYVQFPGQFRIGIPDLPVPDA